MSDGEHAPPYHAPYLLTDSNYPIGTILEVGTPLKTTKLRIIGMETSLEKKGSRYIVEYETGKKASMLILPKDVHSVTKL